MTTETFDLRFTTTVCVNRRPYTVNNIKGADTARVPANSPWANPTLARVSTDPHINHLGITFSGGVPYISATSFKGRLRSMATHRIVLPKIAAEQGVALADVKINFKSLFGMEKGGKLDKPRSPVDMNTLRLLNPVMGLFGGAFPDFIEGRVLPGNIVAIAEPDAIQPIRRASGVRHILDNDVMINHVSDPEAVIAEQTDQRAAQVLKLEYEELSGRAAKAKKKEGEALNEAEAERFKELEKQKKTFSSVAVNDQQLIEPFCFLQENTNFKQTISVQRALGAEVGLLILAMQEFRKHPFLGARAGQGFGADLDIDWAVEMRDETGEFVYDGLVSDLGPRGQAFVASFNEGQFDFEATV